MPLWNNEVWRARIGLCWCALGRTFNTRFTRCRGKSQKNLSTHQAATMVIIMILFIAANLGLYVTRERHKNLICIVLFGETITELHIFRFGLLVTLFIPVSKFVVQMLCGQLPEKLKLSLKQFFIDLNDCLWFIGSVTKTFFVNPVLFAVTFMTGNICNVLGNITNHLTKLTRIVDQLMSNRILTMSLVVVIVVTIQLFVSVMIARAIIFLLLLISGDVERNPGPGNSDYSITKELLEDLETTAIQASLLLRCGDVETNPGPLTKEDIQKVDNSTSLTEDHLKDVFHEVKAIKSTYYQLGVELGLPPGELDPLRMTSIYNIDQALNDMLLIWLRQRYSVETHGPPTWCRLVEAVNKGNYNPSLAITIANKHLVNGVAPIVKILHDQYSSQSSHLSSIAMLPQPVHVSTHMSPHASSNFIFHPPVHLPMPLPFSPYSHDQGYPVIPAYTPNQTDIWPHWRGNFAHFPYDNATAISMFAHAQTQPHYVQGVQSSSSNWTLHPGQSQDEGFPVPKRHKPDPSQPPLGQVPLSDHDLPHIFRWRQMLKDYYFAQEHSTDSWPPLKIVKFIKLALVKEDEHAYHLGLKTVQKDIDAVYGQKSNANYENLFQNIDNESLVLFEGRPGSGKTTLMVKVSCDWGRANIFKSKLVIFVRLRHLNRSKNVDLHDLLQVACPAFTTDDVQGLSSYIQRRLGEDVVFLLDGFDEYAPGESDDNYISKLILKLVYTRSLIVLSSRPAATQRFRQNASVWIEVVGFMKEQVLQYINCNFEQNKEKSSLLIKHLEEHQNLMNICYLPLHCAMLVFLYKVDAILPETETEFYRDFTLSLLIRGIRKHTNMPPNIESFDCLSTSEQIVFHKVCKLAFKATLDSRQVFKECELKDICFNNSSEDSLGLVVVDRYFAKSGVDETYTFLHLTLQEYLAAVYVSVLSESEQINAISTYFGKQNLFVTSRFLFGILNHCKQTTKNLFNLMLDRTQSHLLHHIQCAYESHSASACTDVVNFHVKKLSFDRINNLSDIFYITYVLKTGEYNAIELSFLECNFCTSDAVSLLQGVRDYQLSLTIKEGKAAQSMLNALGLVRVPSLTKLFIAFHDFTYKHLTMGPNHLEYSTNLQKLELQKVDISNSGLKEALKHWPNLVQLKLDRCDCHVLPVAEVLGEGLEHMAKDHHTTDEPLVITLESCNFNKEAALGLLQTVGDRRLSLTITYEYMKMHDAQSFLDALCLVTLPGLIVLDVHVKYLFDGDVYMRPNYLQHSTNLQKLNLFQLGISNSGLEKALKHWPNLVELIFSGCKIDASMAVVLGESLQHTLKLETLDLSHNFVGDDGLDALFLPIKNYCKELKELLLWDIQLTDRSIACLTEWIKALNNIEKLDLDENYFSEGGVKQIKEAVSERNKRRVVKLKLDINLIPRPLS